VWVGGVAERVAGVVERVVGVAEQAGEVVGMKSFAGQVFDFG